MIMPRKKADNSKGNGNKGSDDFKGFAQVFLPDDAENLLIGWTENHDTWNLIVEAGENGYKFSLVWNERGKSWIASLYGSTARTGSNFGWSLSGFGPTAEDALTSLLYKHYVVCEGGGWGGEVETKTDKARFR
jgi:hypothetical protein